MSEKEGSGSDKQEKFTILTQSEEEYQKQMKVLNNINMEQMVEMTLNEDLLKSNFKTITDVLKKQFGLLNMCQRNLNSMNQTDNEGDKIERMLKDQSDLKDLIQKLMKENAGNRQQINILKDKGQAGHMGDMARHSQQLHHRLNDMDNLLQRLYEQMQGQAQHKDYSDDIQLLEQGIQQLQATQPTNKEDNQQSQQMTIQQLEEQVGKLKATVGRVQLDLADKVNCEVFEDTMEGLKNMGGGVGDAGDTTTKVQRVEKTKSRDGNKVGLLEDRVKALEDSLKGQGDRLAELVDNIKQYSLGDDEAFQDFQARQQAIAAKAQQFTEHSSKIDERLNKAEDNKADRADLKKLAADRDKMRKDMMEILNKMRDSISSSNQKAEGHTNEIEELKRKQDQNNKKLGDLQRKQNQQGNQQDMTKIQQNIDQAVGGLKDQLGTLINNLQQDIDKKDLNDQMQNYQQKIFSKIDEIVGALMKKLANKDDTKKALAYLEKKITELYLMVTPEEKNKNDLDGLLVKRPLFWSCVTCDKDVDQYQAKNWSNQPSSNRKPNLDHDKQKDQSVSNTTGLPEIHNNQQEKSKYIVRK